MSGASRSALVLTLMCLAPFVAEGQLTERQAAAAEGLGVSGFFEWIHRLSGPGFLNIGLSAFRQSPPDSLSEEAEARTRVSVGVGFVVKERAAVENNVSVNMLTAQVAYEIPIVGDLYGVAGAALHGFFGDFERVVNYSVPLGAQYRCSPCIVTIGSAIIIPVFEVSANLFTPFKDDAFSASSGQPRLVVHVERANVEPVLDVAFRLDVRRR
jgi:hypothetical protein